MPSHTLASPLRLASVLAAAVVLAAATNAGAVVLSSQSSCQKAITKSGRVYAARSLKAMQRCSLERLSGAAPGACSDPAVTQTIAKAASSFDSMVTKACAALSSEELTAPRPAGLSLAPLPGLLATLRAEHDRLVGRLVASLYPASGTTPGDAGLDCQSALDRAAAKQFASAFRLIGTSCHSREDIGRSVTGEVSRIVEACLESEAETLDAAAAKQLDKVKDGCSDVALAELSACPALVLDRSADAVAACLFDLAKNTAAAAIASEHGRDPARVVGHVEGELGGDAMAAAGATIVLVAEDGSTLGTAVADATGRVDLEARPLERATLCWERGGIRSCANETIDVGLETQFFNTRTIAPPAGANEQALIVRVLRADGSPCFDAAPTAELALRGEVALAPTGSPAGGARQALGQNGGVFVFNPMSGSNSVHAFCGTEEAVLDLGPSPVATTSVVVQMTNAAPHDGSIEMTTSTGDLVTDPALVHAGDTITLHAAFVDSDPLEYRWEITRGDGSLSVSGQPAGDDRRASGPDVSWVIGGAPGVHQVTLWVSDRKGGVESLVQTLGPIDVGPLTPGPCLALPKLQKILCGTGYTALVPDPAGGRSEFLSYKYRNASRNSPGDACLYYNVVDPECIDLNCDGVVDPGTDPMGKCKRTTLGGWWEKNGFNTTTGLGSDVITAWYLNSNDLGFGREMHCRVTSWSSIIAERPVAAPTSVSRMMESLRSDILASPQVVQWTKLFGLYPSTVACYVVNYTTDHCFNYPTNDPENANLAYQGQQAFVANPSVNPPNAYGTVAMEFGPVEGFGELGPITKFFVYNGHTASGKRLTAANLDGCGPKSVPELCMHCHGGNWPGDWSQGATLDSIVAGLTSPGVLTGIDANDTAPTDAGFLLRKSLIAKLTREESGFSSFVPFDPDTYVFPAAASSAAQAASIRSLNQLVLYTKPVNPIRDLVKGWYSNNLATGTFAPWRPTAWNDDPFAPGDESDLHDEVYAKACRGCHASHYSFSSPLYFPSSSRICKNGSGLGGGTPTMPHAKLTYLNLWKGDFPQSTTMPTIEAWFTASEGGFVSCD